jgi:HlyD family secretion protein
MIRKLILPALAFIGVIFAVFTVIRGNRPMPVALPVADPSQAPYANYIAGSGILEAQSENIEIGTITPGVVSKVYVKYGDNVKAGAPLFTIDDRDLQADLLSKKAALAAAQATLDKMLAEPRPEDIPPAQAAVDEARANVSDAQTQLDLYDAVADQRAITRDDYNKRKYALESSKARLAQAEANLAELKAGAWAPDIAIDRANVQSAQAAVDYDQVTIDRLTVRAPIDGQLLQVNIHTGEFATAGELSTPLMLMGNIDKLCVRTDIDENDAWRWRPGSHAVANLRGNRDIKADLTFVRVEPYVIPKKSLTGDNTERVDTRVLQVLYSFDKGDKPMYVGQQMDVFIDAGDASNEAPAPPGAANAAQSAPNAAQHASNAAQATPQASAKEIGQ